MIVVAAAQATQIHHLAPPVTPLPLLHNLQNKVLTDSKSYQLV
jgi:hypothetical protein